MKAIVIGANGQLGWEVCRSGFEIVALDIPEFDITDSSAVEEAVSRSGISLVINASAYTAVDKAESEPELAFAINRDGPAYLVESPSFIFQQIMSLMAINKTRILKQTLHLLLELLEFTARARQQGRSKSVIF